MEVTIQKETIEALLIMLYQFEEFDTCDMVLQNFYKKYFIEDPQDYIH